MKPQLEAVEAVEAVEVPNECCDKPRLPAGIASSASFRLDLAYSRRNRCPCRVLLESLDFTLIHTKPTSPLAQKH
jgi:hypothetical protein